MGYDRNDRRYGSEQSSGYRPQGRDYERGGERAADATYGRDRGYSDYSRGRGDYGRPPQGYDHDDRGFFDRAGDEVRSWFGDEEAERRRRYDDRYAQREQERDASRYAGGSYGRDTSGRAGVYGEGSFGGSGSRDHDPNYRSWRDRQIEALDRDYDDYRREHQSKFDTEFSGWRGKRQGQRDSLKQAQEHQEVVGSDGQHIGKVDHVRGDRILLAKNDAAAGGHHHSIPSSWIVKVSDKVEIDRTAEQAKQAWKDEESNSAIGGSGNAWSNDRDGGRTDGPHNLNRSFSGTY